MKTASLSEIKTELQQQHTAVVIDLCIRLGKFKKENKELLTYLLFESDNTFKFIESIKEETDLAFKQMNTSNLYFVKKSMRKAVRLLNKYSRYCGSDQMTIEMLLYFCSKLKHSGIPFENSAQLLNLYNAQLKKIQSLIQSLHEDLQYDYGKELEKL